MGALSYGFDHDRNASDPLNTNLEPLYSEHVTTA